MAHYTPRFTGQNQNYIDWIIAAVIAAIGTLAWQYAEKKERRWIDNDKLYYWFRTIIRYRLAIGVFAYGFIKLFPVMSPYPSISNLNTEYGYYTDWKIFALSLGVVPGYESFLGLVEVLAAALLLYRRTASIGAFILLFFIGNIFFSNLAYDGGEYMYSFYLFTLAVAVFSYDADRLYTLTIGGKPASPNTFKPLFKEKLKYIRIGLKAFVLLFFVLLYGTQVSQVYHKGGYKYPVSKGLPNAEGIYNVSSFVINKDTLAYSLTDPVRWKNVVFEKWATISILTNRPVIVDTDNIERVSIANSDRNFEEEEAGSRLYYSYIIDSLNHRLYLKNKNSHYPGDSLQLNYSMPSDGKIILSGIDSQKDSINVLLDKIDKKYLLEEAAKKGRRRAIKI